MQRFLSHFIWSLPTTFYPRVCHVILYLTCILTFLALGLTFYLAARVGFRGPELATWSCRLGRWLMGKSSQNFQGSKDDLLCHTGNADPQGFRAFHFLKVRLRIFKTLVSATTEASQASLSISLIIYVGLGPQSRDGCPAMIDSPTAPQRWFRSGERTGCLSGKPSCTLARTPHLYDVYKYQAHHTRLLRRKETPKPRDWLVIFSRCHWTYPRIASSLLGCQPSPGDPPVNLATTSPKTAPKGYGLRLAQNG